MTPVFAPIISDLPGKRRADGDVPALRRDRTSCVPKDGLCPEGMSRRLPPARLQWDEG